MKHPSFPAAFLANKLFILGEEGQAMFSSFVHFPVDISCQKSFHFCTKKLIQPTEWLHIPMENYRTYHTTVFSEDQKSRQVRYFHVAHFVFDTFRSNTFVSYIHLAHFAYQKLVDQLETGRTVKNVGTDHIGTFINQTAKFTADFQKFSKGRQATFLYLHNAGRRLAQPGKTM